MTVNSYDVLVNEVIKIRQLLEMSLRSTLKNEIESILSTQKRKSVWIYSDGNTDKTVV